MKEEEYSKSGNEKIVRNIVSLRDATEYNIFTSRSPSKLITIKKENKHVGKIQVTRMTRLIRCRGKHQSSRNSSPEKRA
jgi:hypothetical protein